MITLTPISASASSSSSSEPVCYLLELDEARILLDMGQRDYRASSLQTAWEYEEKVRELAPTLSLVLLSHSPATYLSLYPYARAHWGLKCPVYATQPTVEMGRVVCLSEAESWRGEHAVELDGSQIQSGDGDVSDDGDEGMQGTKKDKGKKPLRGPFVPTTEEVHEAFDWIKAIRYNQPLHLGGDLSHLLLTPFPSGHTLGGSLFKLRSPTSGTVLYAVGMNHTGERHIDGMVGGAGHIGYDEGVLRPDLLIVEAGRSMVVNPKRRQREAAILDLVTRTLESHYSLLLPCDPSPRLLELLVLLDQHWSFKTNPNTSERRREPWVYPLCLVSKTAQDMVAFARSLIEWMGGVVRDSWIEEDDEAQAEAQKRKRRKGRARDRLESSYGALDFKHVQFFASPTDLLQAYPSNRPKLVLAIPPSMSHGPSRWLFTAMAGVEGNVVLLTSRGEDNTLASDLFERWQSSQESSAKWGMGNIGKLEKVDAQLTIEMDSKVPLMGAELEAHLEVERMQKEREAAHQAAVDRSRRMLEADDLDSDSDSDSESGEAADGIIIPRTKDANAFAGDGEDRQMQMSFDIYVKGQQTRIGRGAATAGAAGGAGATGAGGEMSRFRMFPFVERRGRKVDDYGEGLDVGQWVRKGREIEEEGETEDVREAKRKKEEQEEKQKAPPEPPSKYVSESFRVDVKASLFYVDMDGLHDGQAIKTIISDLQPRKLILVRSTLAATQSLTTFLSSIPSIPRDVHSPAQGDSIRIGEHVQSYSFMLGDSISAGLSSKWSKFEGYEVTMVDGKFAFSAGSTVPVLEAASVVLPKREVAEIEPAQAEKDKQVPLSDIAPEAVEEQTAGDAVGNDNITVKLEPGAEKSTETVSESTTALNDAEASTLGSTGDSTVNKSKDKLRQSTIVKAPIPLPLPSSLFIGDLRLTSLKARLQALPQPMPAEFAGEGILICGPGVSALMAAGTQGGEGGGAKAGSIVAVRKVGEGNVVIEGGIGRVYEAVRKEVYACFAQVSGA